MKIGLKIFLSKLTLPVHSNKDRYNTIKYRTVQQPISTRYNYSNQYALQFTCVGIQCVYSHYNVSIDQYIYDMAEIIFRSVRIIIRTDRIIYNYTYNYTYGPKNNFSHIIYVLVYRYIVMTIYTLYTYACKL